MARIATSSQTATAAEAAGRLERFFAALVVMSVEYRPCAASVSQRVRYCRFYSLTRGARHTGMYLNTRVTPTNTCASYMGIQMPVLGIIINVR